MANTSRYRNVNFMLGNLTGGTSLGVNSYHISLVDNDEPFLHQAIEFTTQFHAQTGFHFKQNETNR